MAFQGDSIFWVEVEKIVPNPYQPRREFDESKLSELAESIRMYGILQPLTVTRKEIQREDGTFYSEYELIAGERRLRASKVAGVSQVPVIIRDGEQSEQEKLELAIIENLQREDLNAVDRALAFKQLAEAFGLSHTQVAKKVGRSREYVSNSIRLLQLPEYILSSLRQGDIGEGHARTLLMLNERPEELDTVYREILLKKMSVREVENIARKIATDKVRKKDWHGLDPELLNMERQLTETLGTRVQIMRTDYGGKVTIDYFSSEDLTAMLALFERQQELRAQALRENEASEAMRAASALMASTPLREASEHTPASESIPVPTPEPELVASQQPEPATPAPAPSAPITPDPRPAIVEETTVVMQYERPPVPAPTPLSETAAQPQYQPSHPVQHQSPEPESTPMPTSGPTPTPDPAPITPPQSNVPPAPVEPEIPEQKPETSPESEVDESTLYSIRNFSV